MATGSLLGKADAALVKAATDAAMANVPVDVSRIHERMMRSHERTMRSIGQSWVQGITGAMQIGGALVKQAQQRRKQEAVPYENSMDFDTLPELTDAERIEIEEEFPGQEEKYSYTNITGNTEIVKPQTVREHLKDIR